MDFLKKNKVAIGGVAVLLIGGYVYFTYFSGSSSAPLTAVSADTAISGNLLTTLNSLHTIQLDNGIFTDPVFVSLSDFGVPIPPETPGRGNPFAPIGQGGAPATTTP